MNKFRKINMMSSINDMFDLLPEYPRNELQRQILMRIEERVEEMKEEILDINTTYKTPHMIRKEIIKVIDKFVFATDSAVEEKK